MKTWETCTRTGFPGFFKEKTGETCTGTGFPGFSYSPGESDAAASDSSGNHEKPGKPVKTHIETGFVQ